MEIQNKVNVDFKPAKRMKKRKELDALIHKASSKGQARSVKHELLRDESNSSEVEEYNISEREQCRRVRRNEHCCTALIACGVILVILCMTLVGTLVWMYLQLRNDIHVLKARVDTGSNFDPAISDLGLKNTNEIFLSNYTTFNKQIIDLHELVVQLKTNQQFMIDFKNSTQLLLKHIGLLGEREGVLTQMNTIVKPSDEKIMLTLEHIYKEIQDLKSILAKKTVKEVKEEDARVLSHR